jgi:hypothetical protein
MLCRERLFTYRSLFKISEGFLEYYKFPYLKTYVCDLEDTIDFSLNFLNTNALQEKAERRQHKLDSETLTRLELKT